MYGAVRKFFPIKSEKAHLVCFAEFSLLLRASEGRFERFISHRLAARAVTVIRK